MGELMAGQCPECGKKSLFKYKRKSPPWIEIMVKCAKCGYEKELDSYLENEGKDEDDNNDDDEDEETDEDEEDEDEEDEDEDE